MAVLLHQLPRGFAMEAIKAQAEQGAHLVGPAAHQHGVKAAGLLAAHHVQNAAHSRLLAHLHVGNDFVALQHAFDQQFDLAAAGFFAEHARLDHLGVVEDQQVARLQQIGEFVEVAVCQLGLACIQKARGAALGSGVLGNQLSGELEIEITQVKGAAGTRKGSHLRLLQAVHTRSSQGSNKGAIVPPHK
ncbi:hypothetical protein D3C72_1183550 [compost metagenome]